MATWCTIESDPGVFTELIRDIGVYDTQVEEIYSLDDDSLSQLGTVYGLIFLFKWTGERNPLPVDDFVPEYLFYAKQVITNACATQAILSIIMNQDDLKMTDELAGFKEFTRDFPSDLKGEAITNSETMRTVHNSFSRAEVVTVEEAPTGKPDDVFHFISYVPVRGTLYELDGVAGGPIRLDTCTQQNWLQKVRPVIEQRIQRYSGQEIRFNLMAVIKDRRVAAKEQIAKIDEQLQNGGSEVETLLMLKQELLSTISNEEAKMSRYAKDNARRKHNFVGFIYELLKVMAERNVLHAQKASK